MAIINAALGRIFPQVVHQMAQVMEKAGGDHLGGLPGFLSQGRTLKGVFELADGFATVFGLPALTIEIEEGCEGRLQGL
jgi:hypothetical protein